MPKLISYAVDILFYGFIDKLNNYADIDFKNLINILIVMFLLSIINCVFSWIANVINTKISSKIKYNLRTQISNKISLLPSSFFEQSNRGDIISLISNDIEQLSTKLAETVIGLFCQIVFTTSSVILMFSINYTLALCALIIVPCQLLLNLLIVKKSQKNYDSCQNILGEINNIVDETLNGHDVAMAFGKQKNCSIKFNILNKDMFNKSFKAYLISGINNPLTILFSNLYFVIIVIYGAFLCMAQIMTVGGIQAFIQYLSMFNNQASNFVGVFNTTQTFIASFKRVNNFLNLEDITDQKLLTETKLEKQNNDDGSIINFKHVNFSYIKDKPILKDFNLSINEGDTIAIVGPTGAGKTTIIKLLLRFFDNYEGEINLYGQNIKTLDFDIVRRQFAVVLQNIWFYNASIADNIRYGKLDANFDEILNASKIANSDKFIKYLDNKYDTMLFGGSNISYGQKQLIAIARAIIANRDILILDEATSYVDTKTEKDLYEVFDKLIKNKTAIVIAHRLSTIKNANKIIVLNNGKIVEVGNHESLINKKGFYFDLYQSGLNSKSQFN